MLKDMLSIFTDRADFFWELLLEHLEIALVSILIAILFGGLVGILISEFPKAARPALGVINFLYNKKTKPGTRIASRLNWCS